MKTKKYIAPKIEVIEIETEEVISASGGIPGHGDNNWGGGLNNSTPSSSRTNLNRGQE